jgi:CheY-like chemotaxis protein
MDHYFLGFFPDTGTRVKRPRALMVDDERDILDLYDEYLRAAGWAVRTAETGGEALLIAPVYLPDVIVVDLAMPGLNGFQTMVRLKIDPRTTSIPIVVLTGLVTNGSTTRAMRTGARVVLTKPCAAHALKAALEATVTKPPLTPRRQIG